MPLPNTPPKQLPGWHSQAATSVAQALEVNSVVGLSQQEAADRLAKFGPNSLPEPKRRGPWLRFALQLHNPLIYVLLGACIITLLLRDFIDAGIIAGVVLINAVIGFVQEGKAEQALNAVRAMLASTATVIRGGERHEVDAAHLVVGDIVLLESGTRVPADLRLLRVKNLRINEAALTGESMPSEKSMDAVSLDASIGDRRCMAFGGTVVSFGQGRGVVTSTGQSTEIGRIGTLVSEVQPLATPLTHRLDQFARQITLFILAVGAITFLYGHFVRAMPLLDIFLAVVGLAVAAIPEGLPAVVTIVLAIGTRTMARNRAIVRRLPAVETLGSVTVICTDKTGTLTKNEMTVVQVMLTPHTLQVSGAGYAPDGGFQMNDAPIDSSRDTALQDLARCALLCNDARLIHDDTKGWHLVGDPTEGALLTLALKCRIDRLHATMAFPRLDEIPFESEHRFMATLHHDHAGSSFVLMKGAPERVLNLCIEDSSGQPINHSSWQSRMDIAASAGQRVLALAQRELPAGTTTLAMQDITPCFTLLGLVGLIDPPGDEVLSAVAQCQQAGIRVKMITGDHAVTATAIGKQLGLDTNRVLTGDAIQTLTDYELRRVVGKTDVFARASPEHKLRLVSALQAQGELVAMTGDGVNDAPALKAANIGIAMGHKGTDAAREAADLVLTDDNFATIARAAREGRIVFDNIKKSLLFMLPTNGGEAGVILIAVFSGLTLPVTAAQILWVNMITAITLALSLAFEPGDSDVMSRPPRHPTEPLVTRRLAFRVAFVSLLMIAVTFAVFEWELARGASLETARTAAVNMLVVGELFYLFNVRYFTASAFTRDILTGNPVALWMSILVVLFQLLFTYAPPMQQLFRTTPLEFSSWLMIFALGAISFVTVEAEKTVQRKLMQRKL